jgi:hypothetical protein
MTNRTRPATCPPLTEVVQSGPVPLAPAAPSVSQEQLALRVLQRVDLALDRRHARGDSPP